MNPIDTLAINGGKPARQRPLPPNYPGATVMDEAEGKASSAVVRAQSPFRYYGPDVQHAVRHFENEMGREWSIPYVLGVSSGTAALIVAMKALGIGIGDKVIVPAITFLATPGAVVCCNAVPVFADVDDSLNLDAASLENVYDDEVKAIIVVPILGTPVDMDPIMSFARKHKLAVIEDIAQSCGVKYKGNYAGTIGDIGAFSFQMNKLITSGEGGAIMTHSPELYERAVRYHDQGIMREKERFGFPDVDEAERAFVGQNYRMSELTGAILVEQWKKRSQMITVMRDRKQQIVDELTRVLPSIRFRGVIDAAGDTGSSLGLLLPDAAHTQKANDALHAEQIESFILYGGQPVYKIPQIWRQRTADKHNFPFNYPYRRAVRYEDGMCPKAEDLVCRTLFIPISPLLTEEDASQIANGVVKVYKAYRIGTA
ncbi:DegT/DnrJ/EryC1/StrS family aminotransferase [Paenibacillus mendelii]|uniref:DegT/DnrJ/EryC1/StrS family aminotransferase n=1 Tax=Paenibacillus mendelii TaxID=206163 RepID=A0ABV6J3I6_9BACL|nr:DegT/DnrJ/EryC1/StrS family aminotransferase [Paenibacillus mendelii]MCQ6560503.1 DegT/DnrJ/EryC1/StrS family aminotransferase [Paenibacillus mendelii]